MGRKVKATLRGAGAFVLLSACKPSLPLDTFLNIGTAGKVESAEGEVGNSAIAFSPSTYDFGRVRANADSAEAVIAIKNVSRLEVRVTSVSATNSQYSLIGHDCPAVLAPKEGCAATVRFAPTLGGAFSNALSVGYSISSLDSTYVSSMGFLGTGVTPLEFAGIDSIDEVRSTSLRVRWLANADAANFLVFQQTPSGAILRKTALAGASSVTVSDLEPNTAYTFKVQATDALGVVTTTSATASATTRPAPVLTTIANRGFPAHFVTAGQAMNPAIDLDNVVSGSDDAMVYSCRFDRVVDGAVVAGADCGTLGGLVFGTSTGTLSWTPDADLQGPFEFKVTGTWFGERSDEEIFVVDVALGYARVGLIAEFDASFANLLSNASNGPFGGVWKNLSLLGSSWDGVLRSGLWTRGWVGDGSLASPYALAFHGPSGDRVDFGAGLSARSEFMVSAWVKAGDREVAKAHLFGNGGESGGGFVVRQSTDGHYQVGVGGLAGTYEDVVLGRNPKGYWRFEESAAVSGAADTSSLGLHGTFSAGVARALAASSQLGGGRAAGFASNGASYVDVAHSNHLNFPSGFSVSAWIYPTSSTSYRAILGKGSGNPNYCYLFVLDNGTLYPSLYMSTANASWANRATVAATLNAWNHVAATFDPATKSLRYYVNGEAAGSYTTGGSNVETCASSPLEIGTMIGHTYGFQGRLDEVALFDTVLTPEQVREIGSGVAGCSSSTPILENEWVHLGAHVKDADKSLKFYVNGALSCERNYEGDLAGSTSLLLGATASGGDGWTGEIGDLRIYETADAASIAALAAKTRPKYRATPPRVLDGNILHLDAELADGLGPPAAGCALTSWKDLSDNQLLGPLTNFTGCGASSGWNGSGAVDDPYRLSFDGYAAQPNADYLSFAANPALTVANGVSIQLWVRPAGVGGNSGYQALMGKGSNPYNYLLAFDANTLKPSLYVSGANESWSNSSTTSLPPAEWSNVAVTFHAATKSLRYYIDGRLDRALTTAGATMTSAPAAPLEIGTMLNNTYPFRGDMAVISVYDRALDADEVLQNCAAFQGRFAAKLCEP